MNIGDPSRTANSTEHGLVESGLTKKQTHLESLLEASQCNEKRLNALAEFACAILIKIRGSSVPQDGVPGQEKNGGTLGAIEESICNSGDSIRILEVALEELNTTI